MIKIFFAILPLLLVEISVLYLSKHLRYKHFFNFLPSVFWIYFLPMILATVGLIDSKNPVYQQITTYLLPASLLLLLIVVDIRAILKLGKEALLMMTIGSLGIMLATPLVFFLFKNWISPEFWAGFGALSASWTGGSSNMIAVKEAIGISDSVFLPMVIVDTIVPYLWMGILVAFAGAQPLYDRWNRSDKKVLEELSERTFKNQRGENVRLSLQNVILILAVAVLGSFFAHSIAKFLPVIKDVISKYAWTIIIVSALGIGLSFTPARQLESKGASKIGYFILYFVLAAIGAKASLANMGAVFFLILAGCGIVAIHALILIAAARILRAPFFLVAVASQANIGGVASAPVVAEVYQPGLASVGLLLAIFGNIIGTYIGILTARLCFWVSHF
ncbi:MAG: DUF819 family protein [Candidatus Omnitrophica bacterium]|nr:DUF819 family protein [Candidatus Omnitrophota bacterium]